MSRLFIVFFLFLFSCCDCVKQNQLPGKYFHNQGVDEFSDSIEILPDNTYVHKYQHAGGKKYKSAGKWSFNVCQITFEDFIFYNREGGDGKGGLWISRVEDAGDGEIRLNYAREHGIYYEKVH